MKNIAIVWFRNDLRLTDNEALVEAYATHDSVIPVFIFDTRVFRGETSFGFAKTGEYRARFIVDSVRDLQSRFRDRGGELYVYDGHPEEVLFELAQKYNTRTVYCNRERTAEEVMVQDALEQRLWSIGQEVKFVRGKMLYYTSDLPFPIAQTPDVFSTFRKEVEKYVTVRTPLAIPATINTKTVLNLDNTEIPSIKDLGHQSDGTIHQERFKGGESAALDQLRYYLWDTDYIASYKETRNEMLGWDYSSKLSPWLAAGCISPKTIYAELKKYEAERTANRSTYWLFFELLWRDFFRLLGKKHGTAIFQRKGTKQETITTKWTEDMTTFRVWAEARTGVPLIDANMRELNATGYMSNRGRQNVASFLVKDLHVNWQMGAEYFESLLLDYDPCSNYGNWNYVAGVGSDPREDRYFNPLSQSRKYDPQGAYVRHWLPELGVLPCSHIHRPWDLSDEHLKSLGIILGREYPKPAVSTQRW